MPKKRLPDELWKNVRKYIWERDKNTCVHCGQKVTLFECNIDHITSGKLGTNEMKNLRTLCKRCHVLRSDNRHRGMISNALKKGIIPPDWRKHVWDD